MSFFSIYLREASFYVGSAAKRISRLLTTYYNSRGARGLSFFFRFFLSVVFSIALNRVARLHHCGKS